MIQIQEDMINMFLISHFLIIFLVCCFTFAFILIGVRMNPQDAWLVKEEKIYGQAHTCEAPNWIFF